MREKPEEDWTQPQVRTAEGYPKPCETHLLRRLLAFKSKPTSVSFCFSSGSKYLGSGRYLAHQFKDGDRFRAGSETGLNLGPLATVCVPGQTSPQATKYKETLLLLPSRFSHVRLCATPYTPAHQAPPSLGFSRQEHWSGLPFPSPMHESEKKL